MKVHHVKSWPRFFAAIAAGQRTHELRRNDRDYRVGDHIELREYDPEAARYTGRKCLVEVMAMTSHEMPCAVSETALHYDYCILSVRRLAPQA